MGKRKMTRLALCGLGLTVASFTATASADVVTEWNNLMLSAIRTTSMNPPRASRAMGMMSAAVYDAVNSIDGSYSPYFVRANVNSGASQEAAAACAAHRVLCNLFPTQVATFDSALATQLAGIANGPAKTQGMTAGAYVADQILAWRANDNSDLVVPYEPGNDPGEWRPTPPGFGQALLPNWPLVTPFAMTSGSQFRLAGPPALNSPEYTANYNEVMELGRIDSATRTPDQTEIARFWANGGGTVTPPGHWYQIGNLISAQQGLSLVDNARLFAALGVVEADAAISCWDNKYEYNFWRPITAIQEGDNDTNPDTVGDPTWLPLLTTPPFPEYTSGHSTFSGGAAALLAAFFGTDEIAFTIGSDGLPNVFRSYESFSEAALESAVSRMYAGIHFTFSDDEGVFAGYALGDYVWGNYFQVPGPAAALSLGAGLFGLGLRRRRRNA